MTRKWGIVLILVIFTISLNGCVMGRKEKDLQIQGLKNRISVLEMQVRSKDEEINSLREGLNSSTAEKRAAKKAVAEVKSRPNLKQIQTALRNAGYETGVIDGKMGKQTRDAIKAFQRANNLVVDGKVGKRTWNLLKEYLYKKVK